MSRDIGIDLGTATVLVYVKGKGIVLEEPSVVAIDKLTDKVICVGREAQQMLGRTPPNIEVVRPLRDGVISRYEVTLQMLRHFLNKVCGSSLFRPRIMVCIPSGITEVEERAVIDAANQAGARKTYLIEEPVAAALGADIDISMPNGNLIVDIGGGTTDIALISLDNTVVAESVKVGGDKFDEAIIRYIRRKYGVLIGERTAEEVKVRIGSAGPRPEEKYIDIKGRCLSQGLPKAIRLCSSEMVAALDEPVSSILEAVCSVVEKTPPELVGDVLANGIVMTGGGSLLYGLDYRIYKATGIKTRVAKNAVQCVARGTGKALDNLSRTADGALRLSKPRQEAY
ncbi:MAG: rod shape-determining protein MreB [Clostridia bacterium]|nr:rod shape-determining protein MreB [Clostridia bacterium]